MAELTQRKGRRGLARKNVLAKSEEHRSMTVHNVYSSCVSSHGYRNMIGSGEGSHTDDATSSSDPIETRKVTDDVEDQDQKAVEFKGGDQDESTDEVISDSVSCEEEINVPFVSDPNSLRSPTPPPADSAVMPKRRRMKKQLTAALNTLNKAKGKLNTSCSTPFTKTRRKRSTQRAVTDIDAMLPECSSIIKAEMVVKVRYLSNVHRLQMKLTEQFQTLVSRLSQEIGQEQRFLCLYLNDQVLPLSKTPSEVGLTVADIIECHYIKESNKRYSGNESLSIMIQCSNSKRKTEINVTMNQTFKSILETYAEQAGISASSYCFCFDGEEVGNDETPLSLEMEDGDILDFVPASEFGSRNRVYEQNAVITIT